MLLASTMNISSDVIAQTPSKANFVTQVEGIKEYTLSNGLQVLLIPDATQNNLIVNIVYKVGSKHEGYGEKGMAHLLEHMLFKSTKNLGDIKKMLSDKGGSANGTTWYDRTNYYEVFPSTEENLPEGREQECIIRLSRVGYDNSLGYLAGGFDAWKNASKEYDTVQQVTATELENIMNTEDVSIFDVRKPGEFSASHIEYKNLNHTPLDFLNDHIIEFPTTGSFYIHCAGGYRSLIATSILKARGYHNMIDVIGGYGAIKNTGIALVDNSCTSTCSSSK